MSERPLSPPPGGFGRPHDAPNPLPPPPRGRPARAILLVLVAVCVLLAGLIVMTIAAMARYTDSAKNAEAEVFLRRLGKLAELAYVRDGKLCPSVAHEVPSLENVVRGAHPGMTAYISSANEWTAAGFDCLGFRVEQPQYFNYDYQADATSFLATARGAPTGDDKVVTFTLGGRVENGRLVLDREVEKR